MHFTFSTNVQCLMVLLLWIHAVLSHLIQLDSNGKDMRKYEKVWESMGKYEKVGVQMGANGCKLNVCKLT